MKTTLQKHLATLCPSISVRTIWEHDTDLHPDIRKDCDGMDDENPDDWQAWRSEVRATAIVDGEEVTGSDYLGGTWEKYGDNPAVSNPEISGYENDMTISALQDITTVLSGSAENVPLLEQINSAVKYVQALR